MTQPLESAVASVLPLTGGLFDPVSSTSCDVVILRQRADIMLVSGDA